MAKKVTKSKTNEQKKEKVEAKLNPNSVKPSKAKTNFFGGVISELKLVVWPTRKEAFQLTATVIIISLIVAVFVGIIDFSLTKILELLTR